MPFFFSSHCAHLAHNLAPRARSSAAINWCHSTEDRGAALVYAICGPCMFIPSIFYLFFQYLNEGTARKATMG